MLTYQERDFLPYMPIVEKYSNSLITLNNQWENVKLICETSCPRQAKNIIPNMINIQKNFASLQDELIDALCFEALNKINQKANFKAKDAVDILNRNLYERTADAGFLATDDDICRFVSNPQRNGHDKEYITNRLMEYNKKYTIYDDIIILNNDFEVLANLDESNFILGKTIEDSLLNKTIKSNENYTESYKKSALQPNKAKAHIFSKKIIDKNTNSVIGILCLCFRFNNEMTRIFKKHSTDYDGSVITIIDENNFVIASSDENHVPVGVQVETSENDENTVVYYRGVEYISQTAFATGYQGYFGLGWKGHIMIPLNLAFKENFTKTLKSNESDIMSGLMGQADFFSEKLHKIMENTLEINYSLKRIVYNGQILSKDSNSSDEYYRLKPILSSINKIEYGINDIFEKSIQNLFSTVISTSLREEKFLASNCIDIMDRNLYERSNDCRWWAQNPVFKTILSKENITIEDTKALTKVLNYINSLYTVYTSLFVFDKKGKIIATSNPSQENVIGKISNDSYVKEIIENSDENKYFVSSFKASELYNNKYTYIYGASIIASESNRETVGGIGIVFDSEVQFKTLLQEQIASKVNSFAVFADQKGTIISSTNSNLVAGNKINLPNKFFELKNGDSYSEIMLYDNSYYCVGCACSSGYREYKNSNEYKNDVFAFVFEKFADYKKVENAKETGSIEQSDIPDSNGQNKTFATFFVNGSLLALDQSIVLETIDDTKTVSVPGSNKLVKGIIKYHDKFLPVFDMHEIFKTNTKTDTSRNLLILKQKDNKLAALLIDKLNNVLEVGKTLIKPISTVNSSASIVKEAVSVNSASHKVILILDEEKLTDNYHFEIIQEDIEKLYNVL